MVAKPAVPAGTPAIAMLKNVVIATKQMQHLRNAAPHLPKIGVFAGPSGYGKSVAAMYVINRERCYGVEVKSHWTRKAFVQAILREMVITPARTLPDMVDQVAEQLMQSRRPLIVDEADYLVDKGHVDLLRDIYEASGAPMLLIGEENLPINLKKFERFHNRILDWQFAQPCDIEDVATLAEMYSPGVAVSEALQEKILDAAKGVTRRIAVNLDQVYQIAQGKNAKKIDVADLGTRQLYTGTAPTRRGL